MAGRCLLICSTSFWKSAATLNGMELGLKAFTNLEADLIWVLMSDSTSGASRSATGPFKYFFLESRKTAMDFHISENGRISFYKFRNLSN